MKFGRPESQISDVMEWTTRNPLNYLQLNIKTSKKLRNLPQWKIFSEYWMKNFLAFAKET